MTEYETRWVIIGFRWHVAFRSKGAAYALADDNQKVVETQVDKLDFLEYDPIDVLFENDML